MKNLRATEMPALRKPAAARMRPEEPREYAIFLMALPLHPSPRPVRTRTHFPQSSTVLLLIDVINPCDFEGGDAFVRRNLRVARAIRRLRDRVGKRALPIIYVNDNFGKWRSDIDALVTACTQPDTPGAPIVELLRPRPSDFVVLKTKLSGFYGTPLDTMLRLGGVRRPILVGFSTDDCVLFTAADAYMREYQLLVPRDCVGARSDNASKRALTLMTSLLAARTAPSRALRVSTS